MNESPSARLKAMLMVRQVNGTPCRPNPGREVSPTRKCKLAGAHLEGRAAVVKLPIAGPVQKCGSIVF